MSIAEEKLASFDEKGAKFLETYQEEYREISEKAPIYRTVDIGGMAHAPRSFSNYDAYQIGSMIEQYKEFEAFTEENATFNQLGKLPNIAVDVISASYGMSMAPILASMQTIEEVQGIIYYKQVVAADTRQDVAEGAVTVDAKRGWVTDVDSYASEAVEVAATMGAAETTVTQTGGAGDQTVDILIPVREEPLMKVVWADAAGVVKGEAFFQPNGDRTNGTLYSSNGTMTGTINYKTGVFTVTLVAGAAASDTVTFNYHQDLEAADDIPQIDMRLTTTDITSEVLALKQQVSTFKAFQFSKRFGKIADDEAVSDLAGHMAKIESDKVIKILAAQANLIDASTLPGNTAITFAKTNGTAQSDFEYRQGFKFKLGEADSAINLNCGRGEANRYVCGHDGARFMASITGYQKAAPNLGVGPHIVGYLDGIPVVRSAGMPTNDIIGVYQNPQSPFESAAVVATYMPVFLTDLAQFSDNPFRNQRAIGTHKAFKGVVENFVKKITLT